MNNQKEEDDLLAMIDDCAQDMNQLNIQSTTVEKPVEKMTQDPLSSLDQEFQSTLKNVMGGQGTNEDAMKGFESMLQNLQKVMQDKMGDDVGEDGDDLANDEMFKEMMKKLQTDMKDVMGAEIPQQSTPP